MKKRLLLFASAALLGVSAFAQAIVIDGSAVGLTSSSSSVSAGTVLGSNDAITLSVAFDDSYKTSKADKNKYDYYVLNGDSIKASYAIQGNANPKDANGGTPSSSLLPPVQGAVLKIDAKKDGVVAVWGALSTNKSYTVFEGAKPIGYRLVMQTSSILKNIDITIPTDENGVVTEAIAWPEKIVSGDSVAASGNGYIIFNVKADSSYLVNANGSKLTAGGAFYSSNKYFTAAIAGKPGYLELYKEEQPKVSASVSPAAGEVSQLSSYFIITVADAEGVTVNSVDDVVIYDVKGDSIAAKATGSRVMNNMFQVLFEAPITTPGEYELRIPASAYSVEGQTSVDLAYSYTIAVSPQIQEVALKSDTVVTSLVSPIVIEYPYANVIKDATDGGLKDAIEVNRIDPDRGSIYVVLSDVQISGKQILIFVDDAENAAEGDYTILINQGIFSLDGVENDEANFKVTYEAPKQDYVTVNPAAGEVEGLQSFTLTFNNATEVAAAFSREAYPVLYNVTGGHNEFSWTSASVEGNTLTLTTNAPVVYAGEYELRIPAGCYTVDGVAGDSIVVKYTVVASEKTLEATVTPEADAEGNVSTISPIVVTFPNATKVEDNPNADYYTQYAKVEYNSPRAGLGEIPAEIQIQSNTILFFLEEGDQIEGQFVITIPAGTYLIDGTENLEIVDTLNYVKPAQDYVTVNPAEGEVEGLQSFTLTFNNATEVAAAFSREAYPVLYNVTEGHNEFSWTSAVVEGNTLTLTTNAPVVYMGEYELRIPGASYTVDTVAGQDLVLKYTVVASEKTQEYTLANDTVHTMPLVVTFPNVKSVVLNDSLSFSDPYIKVAQAGDTEGEAEIETSTSSNQLLINVAAADLVNGEFTLTIPAGTLWLDGVANTEIVENFTYELLVPDYTLVVTPSDSTTLSAIDVITVNVEGVDEVTLDVSSIYFLVLQSDSLTYLATAAINEEDSTQLVITVIDGDTGDPTSITTPGEYTLYINANVITVNGVKVPTVTEIKFTVGVPTGISRILGDAAVKNIYNLRGVKVDAKTLTPGIYVIDGKKVQLR
jgi:hypothetical protein